MSAAPDPSARQVLEPCPFCNKAMQYRAALFVSDGCTDAVIHAEHTDCGLVQFDIGATDGGVSTIAAWNRRATDPAVAELVEALTDLLGWYTGTGDKWGRAASNAMLEKVRALLAKHAAKP